MSALVENYSGLPHALVEKCTPDGDPCDVIVVRGTFNFAKNGQPVTLAARQQPIVWGEEYAGPVAEDPLRAVIARDGDLTLFKPGTDIHVLGRARPPRGEAAASWLAGLRLGQKTKHLRLYGPRQFTRTLTGWKLGEASPTEHVALDYRKAFGGLLTLNEHLSGTGQAVSVSHPGNPAGCGWLPDSVALSALEPAARKNMQAWIDNLDTLTAPQIESPDEPILQPFQSSAPQGLGPVARWTQPRVGYQGTLDDRWRAERYPDPPEDFDLRYNQSAHPDLVITPYLRGDELIETYGLLPENQVSMRLPGWRILMVATHESGLAQICTPVLDTATFDLDARQLILVWRIAFDRNNPLQKVVIGADDLPAAPQSQAQP